MQHLARADRERPQPSLRNDLDLANAYSSFRRARSQAPAPTTNSSSANNNYSPFNTGWARTSLTQQMKRRLPWVLSSFRSSKRRPQVADDNQQPPKDANSAWDDSHSLNHKNGLSTSRSMDQGRTNNVHQNRPPFVRRTVSEWANMSTVNLSASTLRLHDDDYIDDDEEARLWQKTAQRVSLNFCDENANDDLENLNRQIEVLHTYPDFPPTSSTSSSGAPTPTASGSSPTRALAAMELAHHAAQPAYPLHRPVDLHCGLPGTSKASYVMDELLTTERTYVRELESVVEFYIKPFELPENAHHLPPALRGENKIFGNFRELYDFHSRHVLPEFQRSQNSPIMICHILINYRNRFLALYRPYCQNKPVSESLRRDHAADGCRFFQECQKRAGHQLPLSAYLLKPIQRITKYQLLLKELLRYCQDDSTEEIRHDVQAALAAMLDLLAQINADMQQLHILGYAGDLRLLGPLRLQTECEIFTFKRKTRRLSNKCQKRHLFLFDGGILFCKKRTQPLPYSPEFYEHKMCIYAQQLGFAECSKQSADRFEIWDEQKSDGFAVLAADESVRAKWIQRLARMTVLSACHQQQHQQQQTSEKTSSSTPSSMIVPHSPASRPHSWTSESTVSSKSSSAFDDPSHCANSESSFASDPNGNPSSIIIPEDHHSQTTGSVSSRRSSSHTASLASDAENNTPIPLSKSLQNTTSREQTVSEV